MDFAKCTLDNKVYGASNFSELKDLNHKRKFLICNECGNPAYFKKTSKSGQAACFGARPHKENCSLISVDSDSLVGTLENDEKELINSGNEIKVDFNFGTQQIVHTIANSEDAHANNRRASSHSNQNGIGRATSTRRLKSLLNMLINDPVFAISKQKIDVGHKYPYNASTIFKNFNSLDDTQIQQFRGVYGQIFDVKMTSENVLWINSGGFNAFSIVVSKDFQNNFFNRFEQYKDDVDQLCGKYVLCFGEIKKSKNQKFYIELDDITKIVFK